MAVAPSRAEFLGSYPEFNGVEPATMIDVKLAEAARRTNARLFQTDQLAADAVMLRAAVLLLSSPHGFKLRSANPDQAFAWEWQLRALQRSATLGLRVPGTGW
jgi:hypothetical protein